VIRPSGLYAVIGGETLPVELHGSDYVKLAGPYGMVRREMDELDDFLSVRTSATWRGGRISVKAVSDEECGFDTSDGALAEREDLAGDFYNGWHGAAPLAELTDVDERVTSIHPRRRET
jgi:hypothetical protein